MSRPQILLVDAQADHRAAIRDELEDATGGVFEVTEASTLANARHAAAQPGADLRLVVAADTLPDGRGVDLLDELHAETTHHTARKLIVTPRRQLGDLSGAVDRGALHGVIARPWTPGELGLHLRAQLVRSVSDREAPELARREHERARSGLLGDLELTDGEIVRRLVEALDDALGSRPRLRLDRDTVLVREEEEVNGLWVVLEGRVTLTRRTGQGDARLHESSSGPVIGLLSLTQQRHAFFTCRAVNDVVALHLTVEQLDQALRASPRLSPLLATALLRALARRLRHAESLQLEISGLHREVAAERDRLAEALDQLEAAELQLVESARMATLGEIAAGMAHELNNPVAAVQRAASHLADDLRAVLENGEGSEAFDAALEEPARSTAEERRVRRELREVAEGQLADRLLAAGITDPEQAASLLRRRRARDRDRLLDRLERMHSLGTSLRNIGSASARIAELVESLRGYVRTDGADRAEVDVHEGLDDTLRLLRHRLEGIEVVRHYGELPRITAAPGELNQVWTNLISNAIEAMDGDGELAIRTDQPDSGHVRVRIIDSGAGIAAADLDQIFEPRFTTKSGRVEYGLGLGLAIAHRIVVAHGGGIRFESEPGRTVAEVRLSIDAAPEASS